MASRWRIWDIEFFEEIVNPDTRKYLFGSNQVYPVGSHTNKLNIPAHLLSLPVLEETNVKCGVGYGRGRRNENDYHKQNVNRSDYLKEYIPKSLTNNKLLNDSEWPSLCFESSKQYKSTDSKKSSNINVPGLLFEEVKEQLVGNIREEYSIQPDTENERSVYVTSSSSNLDVSNHVLVQDFSQEEDFQNIEYLKTLSEPQKFVLIECLPLEFDDIEFQETILSFGAIDTFKLQVTKNGSSMNALVKMQNASHCAWVVSCLNGSTELCENQRLQVESVSDILGITEELDLSL